jgi:glutaredoxin
MKLFVKIWCPWCVEARAWLDRHGIVYELVDVEKNRADFDEMIAVSGQRKTPTLLTCSGAVLADFGTDELEVFAAQHNLKP